MPDTRLLVLAGLVLALAGCSFSSGGGGSEPSRTYIIAPNGQAVPVNSQGGTAP